MSVLSIPSANDLNKISMFEDNGLRLVEKHLPMLAQVFIDYKMNKSYAIGYLHRHFNIPKSSIWVHEYVKDADRVVPINLESINMSELQAHSYCLEGGEFKAFEFEGIGQETRETLDTKFLVTLKAKIQEHGLEAVVAICPREKEVMFETLLDHEGGTTASPIGVKPIGEGMTTESAQWCFDAPSDGNGGVKSQRECWINKDGFHFVNDTVDSPSEASGSSAGIASGTPSVKSQRQCIINRGGFHFVNDNSTNIIKPVSNSLPPSDTPSIKSQRECIINRDGFHFVNDYSGDTSGIFSSSFSSPSDAPEIKSQRQCIINRDGFHFVNDYSQPTTSDILSGTPSIKAQRECLINRDGFHFVNDEA